MFHRSLKTLTIASISVFSNYRIYIRIKITSKHWTMSNKYCYLSNTITSTGHFNCWFSCTEFHLIFTKVLIFISQRAKVNYKIIWIVRAFWLANKCVFIVLWSTKMTSAIWLTVSELWEFTVRASYIVFFFVKTENNNFKKEIKHLVRVSIAC